MVYFSQITYFATILYFYSNIYEKDILYFLVLVVDDKTLIIFNLSYCMNRFSHLTYGCL